MKDLQSHGLVRYWFYVPFLMSVTLSLLVTVFLGDNGGLDAYDFQLVGVPLLLLIGTSAVLGLVIHFFVLLCRDSIDSNEARPAYKRERQTRMFNMDDFVSGHSHITSRYVETDCHP